MPAVAPQPSARLVRAVTAERAELERHRARLTTEAAALRAALARIENGLAEIDERRSLLDRLAPNDPDSEPEREREPDEAALRGPAIREVAVQTLVKTGREAMHYRQWFDLLRQQGHAIAGKDPLAVFLPQISRSPAIRRGTRAGVYELDRGAPRRLRTRLDALQREIGGLPAAATEDLQAVRSRRNQLMTEIGRTERALEEVSRLFGSPALTAAPA
jgi:chromosome segregation ATPase